jgi:3-deoxy-manno-octulosonate cytidylyltransferase (CMP-KDO synthetase)
MRDARVLGVIPARLGSERLPRKPLHLLAGRPLIEWVWRRVAEVSALDAVVVATDSEEVAEVCRRFGAGVELTSAAHESGTERVAEIATRPRYRGYDVLVNVQGDEPFVSVEQIEAAVGLVLGGWEVGTVASVVESVAEWQDPGVVKVIVGEGGRALYFSRAPVPYRRDGAPSAVELGGGGYLRHIGIYAYAPGALERWVALPPTALERIERLEQLRPLVAGLGIGVAVVAGTAGGVDTMADAERAAARLREILATGG